MKSMFLSLTALIVAALALINSVCGLQDSNLVISFLGVLVTLLVGWNIIQFIFAENTMHKIARDASDIVASETAKTIADDINHIFEGKLLIQKTFGFKSPGNEMKNVDFIFQALGEYSKCHYRSAAQSSVDAALQTLQKRLLSMKDKNVVRVLEGKKSLYIAVLKDLTSPYLQACNELLYSAVEKSEEYDKQILSPDDQQTLHYDDISG